MKSFSPTLLTLSLVALPALAQTPGEADLNRRVEALTSELQKVKTQMADLQKKEAPAASDSATVIGGYGEVNFNFFTQGDRSRNQADVRRFVLGVTHRFDDRTRMVAEVEVEHAVSSADDPGEVEIEQAYIEHQLNRTWGFRAGLFLVPMGLLNANHEPTAFYGVERNFVETAIIPSTWREGGVQVYADFENGISLQAGVATGFNMGKWDATSTEGTESPLGSVHQELAQAQSHDFSVFGALNWRGIPGLQLGCSIFSGGAKQAQVGVPSMDITLWDAHARWTPGNWDLSALYAAGNISHTAEFNQPLVGQLTLVPEKFHGWYGQAAYRVWTSGSYSLAPFARYESYNTAVSFADLGPGLTPAAMKDQGVWTVGANFNVARGVVVKADVQRFRENKDANRVNLGFGWSF
ncbi:porin [Geothrix sp. 21YS21S-4]|uniref:porin n=1 Tax=Geothrix sp. 21YS21S-4 TaxID=3068889 RepID=UPI0027BA30C4|nr:porin [Geothrix sp. 21YS21S-4]